MYMMLLATLTMQEGWKAAKGKGESWLKSHPLVPVTSSMPIMIWPTQWPSPPSSPIPTLMSADSHTDKNCFSGRLKSELHLSWSCVTSTWVLYWCPLRLGVFRLQCAEDQKNSWHSSPYLGNKYQVNSCMAHGYFISRIRPNQYERIMTATEIIICDTYLNTFFGSYNECVKALAKESTQDTLLEEIVTYDDMDSIKILPCHSQKLQVHRCHLSWV